MLTREISFLTNINPYALGSVMVSFGNTKVHVCVSMKDEAPPHLKGKGLGWLTAEYSMLPMATHTRCDRERKKLSGRTQEIQRLIGRSLRNCLDQKLLGERTLMVDCDVMVADGGTRTASITGAYVALSLACQKLVKDGVLKKNPITMMVAAISVGLDKNNNPMIDLNYEQDSSANVDMNVVMNERGEFLEFQASSEAQHPMNILQTQTLFEIAQKGISHILEKQKEVL